MLATKLNGLILLFSILSARTHLRRKEREENLCSYPGHRLHFKSHCYPMPFIQNTDNRQIAFKLLNKSQSPTKIYSQFIYLFIVWVDLLSKSSWWRRQKKGKKTADWTIKINQRTKYSSGFSMTLTIVFGMQSMHKYFSELNN